jgi:hypothetical protein
MFAMFARKGAFSSIGRAATLATVAAVALTAAAPTMAFAGSASSGRTATSHGTSGATDISAQRRFYHGGFYRGGGPLAAAAFAGIVGTGIAAIAAQNAYGYYGGPGPGYYGGPVAYEGPVYYGGPAYYGGGPYYGYGGWGGYYGGSQSKLPYVPY